MKRLLLLAFLMPILSNAQECDKITVTKDEMKGYIRAVSPTRLTSTAYAARLKDEKNDEEYLVLSAWSSVPDYTAKGVYIKLSDGTFIKDEKIKIDCSYDGDGSYRYMAIFIMNEEDKEQLIAKPIAKFQLDDVSRDIKDKEAEKLQGYIKCISELKW